MALGLAAVEDPDRDAALPHVVSVLLGRLPELGEQLDVEGAGAERMRTTFAPDVEKLGVRRLQLVELICELVHSDFDEVFAALAGQGQENLMQLCLDTFFKFEWNNMLHRIVMGALIAIVERGQNEPAPAGEEWKADGEAASAHGGVVALCRSLFVEYNLLDRILQAYRENDEYAKQPKGCQKGYMGFLHHVCNGLVEAADQPVLTDGNDQGGVDADGEGDEGESSDANLILCFLQGHQAWEDFVDTQLEEINRIERTALGGDNAPPASPALAGLPDCGDPPDDDFDIGSGADGGGTAGGSMLEYDMDDFAEEFDEELGSGSRGGAFGPFDDDDSDDDDSDDDDDDDSDDSDDDEMSEALKAQYGLGGGAVGIVDAFGRPAGGAEPEVSPAASSGSGGFADFGAFPAFGDNAASTTAEPAFDPFGNASAAAATATKPIDVAPVKEEFNSYNFWKPQHAVIDDDDETKA